MTCIVGIAHNDVVHMGADSCGGSSDSWMVVSSPKVFKVENRFLIGCCGSFRMIDLLRFSLTVPKQPVNMSDDAYMRTKFIAAVRKTFKNNGFMSLSEEDGIENGGDFLVGYNGRLYEVQPDFSVLNLPEWGFSIGSGEQPAFGSLHTSRGCDDVKKRIISALEAAEATTPLVRGPFMTLSLNSNVFEMVA